ncbi:MAG: SPFH domain-containing protein [Anaerolineae bacterium]
MTTSRMKWVMTASAIIAGVSMCVAVAAIFPQIAMAAAVGVVAAVVVPPIVISAVFVVVPPSTARVVRDEMGRVVRVLGPGEHLVIPPLEQMSESFSLCWRALTLDDAVMLDAQFVEMEVRLKVLYVVDPRGMRREWRQSILDALHDDPRSWGNYLRGILLEQMQLVLAQRPAEEWTTAAGRHALPIRLTQALNARVAGTGLMVQDVQVFWLAPVLPVRQFYQEARRRAVTAQSWSMALRALHQDGAAKLKEEAEQMRDLAVADALAGRNHVTLHMGALAGWYVPSDSGNGHGAAPSEAGVLSPSGQGAPAVK